ncbi:hypothetical protein ACLOJK_003419 [Asimina triloba]
MNNSVQVIDQFIVQSGRVGGDDHQAIFGAKKFNVKVSAFFYTYEELLEILNSEDTIINNTSPNIEESVSCSSSSDHQPKKEIKQKRRRRPSVRFVDLITKKKLSLGDKVHYRKKNKTELGAGIVRMMGIECCCCGIDMIWERRRCIT